MNSPRKIVSQVVSGESVIVKRARRFFILLTVLAFSPHSLAVEAESAAAEATMELRYSVSWLEIPFARARARLSRQGGEFSVRGESWTAGPLAAFVDYRGFAETTGEWRGGAALLPRTHLNGGEFRGRVREASVLWESGELESQTEPPPDLERVSPVPMSALFGAVDPFTAALAASVRVGREGVCNGTEKVWDGRRLADWTLAPLGDGESFLEISGAWEGDAAVCELHMRKIGGFRLDARHSPRLPPRVWVAEVHPGLWAPVRAEVHSRWGKVVARLESRNAEKP